MSTSAKNFLPPRGMRDITPKEMLLRQHLLDVITRTYRSFGYLSIETPALESLDILLGKGGSENEKLIFRVLKRGEKLEEASAAGGELADLGLRYDLTVPLARYVAAHAAELPPVFRVYRTAPVWRADRPQKGRFREFMQCDIDVVGGTGLDYEVEVLTTIESVLAQLNLGKMHLRLSDKRLLPMILGDLGADADQVRQVTTAVDKLDKVGMAAVRSEIDGAGLPHPVAAAAFALLDHGGQGGFDDFQARFAPMVAEPQVLADVLAGLQRIETGLRAINEDTSVRFDPILIRGMDYYTGPVFEAGVEGFAFSVAGGGRYDGLIGHLSKTDIPAVGASIGFDRLVTILGERDAVTLASPRRLRLVIEGADGVALQRLAARIRRMGFDVDVDFTTRKFERRLKSAEAEGIARVVTAFDSIGDTVTVRDLGQRQSHTMAIAELAGLLTTS